MIEKETSTTETTTGSIYKRVRTKGGLVGKRRRRMALPIPRDHDQRESSSSFYFLSLSIHPSPSFSTLFTPFS